MVESMDDAVGTLLDALDRLGIATNTIIVFTSDNGGNMYNEVDGTTPTSNRPLRGGKATLFEGGTRVPCVIAWPGVTKSGVRSDAIIQSEDYYPTLLAGLGLKPAPDQRFDGISILPALNGGELVREATFQFFPHDPPVPDWLPPAVSMHSGDWKLIRIFHGGENGAHRHLLFNTRDDLSEKNNLAANEPDRVKAMDAQIEKFLADTKAVVPVPNPTFDPAKYHPEEEGVQKDKEKPKPKSKAKAEAKPKAVAAGDDDPKLLGWKARSCTVTVADGIATVNGNGASPFLGFAAGKITAPATMKFRIRSESGGAGKVECLPAPTASDQAKSVAFQFAGGDWQEPTVELPADAAHGVVRLYLPAQKEAVQIDWIELKAGGQPRRWDF
jgi:hypothetical protein